MDISTKHAGLRLFRSVITNVLLLNACRFGHSVSSKLSKLLHFSFCLLAAVEFEELVIVHLVSDVASDRCSGSEQHLGMDNPL